MLKAPPINLNKQSQDATIQLIRDVLQCGIQLSDVSVSLSHRGTKTEHVPPRCMSMRLETPRPTRHTYPPSFQALVSP